MERPVVASSLGQIKEVIVHGKNGLLVKPGDSDGLVNEVLQLVQNPSYRRELGKNGRKTIEANYTWKRNVEKVMEIACGQRKDVASSLRES